jgi:hypothetical protein
MKLINEYKYHWSVSSAKKPTQIASLLQVQVVWNDLKKINDNYHIQGRQHLFLKTSKTDDVYNKSMHAFTVTTHKP